MADTIRVLIVDDIPETRDHLTKLLGFEADIEVIGAASTRQVYVRDREKASRIVAAAPVAVPAADVDGEVIAVFSPKGGVGRTTMAVNLAVAAAQELGKKVCLVDASFQFGDVGVLLNLNPKNKSIADLVPELELGEAPSLETFVINHSSGIRVL